LGHEGDGRPRYESSGDGHHHGAEQDRQRVSAPAAQLGTFVAKRNYSEGRYR
jgi:hypothetical protein